MTTMTFSNSYARIQRSNLPFRPAKLHLLWTLRVVTIYVNLAVISGSSTGGFIRAALNSYCLKFLSRSERFDIHCTSSDPMPVGRCILIEVECECGRLIKTKDENA